jgi:hypothetical protein
MRPGLAFVALTAVALLGGCGTAVSTGSSDAAGMSQAPAATGTTVSEAISPCVNDYGGSVVAEYHSTVDAVRAWLNRRRLPATGLSGRSGGEAVVVCWSDGANVAKSPPGGAGSSPYMDRAVTLVDSIGRSELLMAGHADGPPEPP